MIIRVTLSCIPSCTIVIAHWIFVDTSGSLDSSTFWPACLLPPVVIRVSTFLLIIGGCLFWNPGGRDASSSGNKLEVNGPGPSPKTHQVDNPNSSKTTLVDELTPPHPTQSKQTRQEFQHVPINSFSWLVSASATAAMYIQLQFGFDLLWMWWKQLFAPKSCLQWSLWDVLTSYCGSALGQNSFSRRDVCMYIFL